MHFLTFGLEPRQPGLLTLDLCCEFYGDSNDNELTQCLHFAQNKVKQHNENAIAQSTQYTNQNTRPHSFQTGQLVLLDKHSFLHKNNKTCCQIEQATQSPMPSRPHQCENQTQTQQEQNVNWSKPYITAYKKPHTTTRSDPSHKWTSSPTNQSSSTIILKANQLLQWSNPSSYSFPPSNHSTATADSNDYNTLYHNTRSRPK
jgi:hypothetical protein